LGSHDIKGAALAPLKTETGGPPKSKKAPRGRKPIDIEVREVTATEAAREIGRCIKNYDADLLPDNSPTELLAEPLQPVGDQKIVVDGNEPPKTPKTPQPPPTVALIRDTFGSSALESFLTAEIFTGRVLGASQMLSFPTNVLFVISGNNFLPKGDLWSRILTMRIDAKTADPERRAFKINPLEHCARHRQEMVAAGLILLRGFIAAGKPRDENAPDRLASFELWDDLVRQCVIWIGRKGVAPVSDPTTCIHVAKECEPERVKLGAFLETVWTVFKEQAWKTAELLEATDMDNELKEVLDQIAARRGKFNPHILGSWISRQADVRFGGRRIVRDGIEHKVVRWRIETDDPAETRGGLGVPGGVFPVKDDFFRATSEGLNGFHKADDTEELDWATSPRTATEATGENAL
jgi:hypothetical protein